MWTRAWGAKPSTDTPIWAVTHMLFIDNSKLLFLQILYVQSCRVMWTIKLHNLFLLKKYFLGWQLYLDGVCQANKNWNILPRYFNFKQNNKLVPVVELCRELNLQIGHL